MKAPAPSRVMESSRRRPAGSGDGANGALVLLVVLACASNRALPTSASTNERPGEGHQHAAWSYLQQSDWAQEYPECRGPKMRQSPVNIATGSVQFKPDIRLELIDYDQLVEFNIKNTHHSVSLTPVSAPSKPGLRLSSVAGGAHFELQEIHFHWGDGASKGSEHQIDGRRAAAEMHMVHYRQGVDKSQIGLVPDSVAVVAVLIESDSVEHNQLEPIVKKTQNVNGTDAEYKDDSSVRLIELLAKNHYGFYTYSGSLTTPPCYEVVTWIILSEPVYMSQQSLLELSNLEAQRPQSGRQKIARNYRDVQPLLNRPVYASFNTTDTSSYIKLDDDSRRQQHLDQNGVRPARVLVEYWKKISNLPSSISQTLKKIETARQKLLIRLSPS